jgi:hypothetical protein
MVIIMIMFVYLFKVINVPCNKKSHSQHIRVYSNNCTAHVLVIFIKVFNKEKAIIAIYVTDP